MEDNFGNPYAPPLNNFGTNNQQREDTTVNPFTAPLNAFGTNNQVIEDTVDMSGVLPRRGNFGTKDQVIESTTGADMSGLLGQRGNFGTKDQQREDTTINPLTGQRDNFGTKDQVLEKTPGELILSQAEKGPLKSFAEVQAEAVANVTPANEFVGSATTLDNIKVMDVINEEILRTGGLSLSTARQLEANTPFTMVQINEMVTQATNPAANPLETSGNLSFVEQIGPMPFVNRGMNPSTTQLESTGLIGPKPMLGPANMTRTQLENNQLLGQFEQAKADFAANNATNTSVDTGIIGPMPMFGPANQTNTSGSTVTNNNMTNLETTNTNPYIDTTVVPPPEDTEGGPGTAQPVGSGTGEGDSDITTPPDDNGNCPPGYIMKFINGMYICVPIEEEVEEEEVEEEKVVTYGRPRAGSYYQPRTVGPISPYILNSDEV
tara:strand:- start:557 stop:1861 length:1305 start_codon:yes stop_codon:yes gene_type:complete